MTKLNNICILLLVAALASGCADQQQSTTSTSDDHEPKHATFKAAVEHLIKQRNTIRDGFAANDVDAAHGPLHEVGNTLEELVKLAEKEGISGDELETVKNAEETLFDAFENVDKTLHGGEGSTYEEEADTINAAMKSITDIAGVEDDSAEAEPGQGDMLPAGSETEDVPAPATDDDQ